MTTATEQESSVTTFATPRPIDLTVSVVTADLRVRATERTDTVVVVTPSDPDDADDVTVAAQTRVEHADGHVTVTGARLLRRFSPFSRGGSVDVDVEVPTGSTLRADGQILEVRSTGTLGSCRIRTTTGALDLEDVGPAELTTSGTITVGRIDGDAELGGVGRIRVATIAGRAVVDNSNGATVLGTVEGPVRCRSANGDITVEHPGDDLEARTANGDVLLGAVSRGSVDVETSNGRLEIGIRHGTAASLDVHTRFGRIDNRLDEADAPEAGDETAVVRARTGHGDIVLRRAHDPIGATG